MWYKNIKSLPSTLLRSIVPGQWLRITYTPHPVTTLRRADALTPRRKAAAAASIVARSDRVHFQQAFARRTSWRWRERERECEGEVAVDVYSVDDAETSGPAFPKPGEGQVSLPPKMLRPNSVWSAWVCETRCSRLMCDCRIVTVCAMFWEGHDVLLLLCFLHTPALEAAAQKFISNCYIIGFFYVIVLEPQIYRNGAECTSDLKISKSWT